MHRRFHCAIFALTLCCLPLRAQQVGDTGYTPPIAKPAYAQGKGPLVLLDEAHHNFHTASGRYLAFAELLRRDGYVVHGSTAHFSKKALRPAKVLVIANALHESNVNNWTLPTPSAFTDEEVAAVREWVHKGGALLLIADHMPFPGAAEHLGAAFGITFANGYARSQAGSPDVFQRADKSLREHPITNGRNAEEHIDTVATFTGSAFQIPNAQPLLVLGDSFVSWRTSTAGEFTPTTPREPVNGWFQGAVLSAGKGRVAVFGTTRRAESHSDWMNAPAAKQNHQFLLNVMHWLSKKLK